MEPARPSLTHTALPITATTIKSLVVDRLDSGIQSEAAGLLDSVEVSAVGGGDIVVTQALGDRDDRRVHGTQRQVRVLANQRRGSGIVAGCQRDEVEFLATERGQEIGLSLSSTATTSASGRLRPETLVNLEVEVPAAPTRTPDTCLTCGSRLQTDQIGAKATLFFYTATTVTGMPRSASSARRSPGSLVSN